MPHQPPSTLHFDSAHASSVAWERLIREQTRKLVAHQKKVEAAFPKLLVNLSRQRSSMAEASSIWPGESDWTDQVFRSLGPHLSSGLPNAQLERRAQPFLSMWLDALRRGQQDAFVAFHRSPVAGAPTAKRPSHLNAVEIVLGSFWQNSSYAMRFAIIETMAEGFLRSRLSPSQWCEQALDRVAFGRYGAPAHLAHDFVDPCSGFEAGSFRKQFLLTAFKSQAFMHAIFHGGPRASQHPPGASFKRLDLTGSHHLAEMICARSFSDPSFYAELLSGLLSNRSKWAAPSLSYRKIDSGIEPRSLWDAIRNGLLLASYHAERHGLVGQNQRAQELIAQTLHHSDLIPKSLALSDEGRSPDERLSRLRSTLLSAIEHQELSAIGSSSSEELDDHPDRETPSVPARRRL